jgi:hypothetical protein
MKLKLAITVELEASEGQRLTKALIRDVWEQVEEDIIGRLDGDYSWQDEEGDYTEVALSVEEMSFK